MQLRRNEIMTGLLVLTTVAVLTFILILLGAPGLFRPLVTYRLYFDNAAAIKLGAPVLLAGRQVGQVKSLNSPVSREESAHALEAAGNLGTVTVTGATGAASLPHFEVRIDIEVDRNALVYKNSNVRLMTLGLLGETAIDISGGNDHSGKAEAGPGLCRQSRPGFFGSDRETARRRSASCDGSDRDLERIAKHRRQPEQDHRRKFAAQPRDGAVQNLRRTPHADYRFGQLPCPIADQHSRH